MKTDEELNIRRLTRGYLIKYTSVFPGKGVKEYEYAVNEQDILEFIIERIENN